MSPAALVQDRILENAPGCDALRGPMRILAVWPAEDAIWLIELPRKHPTKGGQMRGYIRGPVKRSLSQMSNHLANLRVVASAFTGLALLELSDDQILATATSAREAKRLQKMLNDRDLRWQSLAPILSGSANSSKPRSFNELITDPRLGAMVIERAKEIGQAPSTLYNLLHQYLALGSRRNSLCTGFWRCGRPGQPKGNTKKLGRPSRLHLAGESGPGVTLDEDAKSKLAFGFRLVKHGHSAHDAYLLCSAAFWSARGVHADGTQTVDLMPADQRPTFAQFLYWGKKGNSDKSIGRLVMGERKWDQRASTQGKSIQDQVSTACQLACFDGTSTDVYLTSMRSRLIKLPPMTRLILKEVRTGLVYGLYCGWDPPSPTTALLTILHGAASKVEYCRQFGIEIQEGDWPSFLARTHQADNGELKAESLTNAEEQFGFSIEYTPTSRGDKKGGIETQHHTDHKLLDHRLPGTTKGHHRERGEDVPATQALLNYHEYMRELIWHILEYNNQEVIDLAPLAMLREQPNVPPTRRNIFRWLEAQCMTSGLVYDINALRAFSLPDQPAVVRKNGIYLMATLNSDLKIVPKLRYRSDQLVAMGLLSKVKRSQKTIRVSVKLNPNNLQQAWLPTSQGMMELQLQGNDSELRQLTLHEWCRWVEEMALGKDQRKGQTQQARLVALLRRNAIKTAARQESQKEEGQLAKPLSKVAKASALKANRDQERELLNSHQSQTHTELQRMASVSEPLKDSKDPEEPVTTRDSAAARAMRKFNQSRTSGARS